MVNLKPTRKNNCIYILLVSMILNSSSAEGRIFQMEQVNTTAADALVPCIARSSAAMALIMRNTWVLVFHKERFQLTTSSQCWQIQSSAFIMQPNTVRYCINNCRNWGRISKAGPAKGTPYLARYGVSFENTVECCYNTVLILPKALRRQWRNVNQSLNSQQTPHTSP